MLFRCFSITVKHALILNSLDFLILLALVVGVVRGFMTGAVRQVVSIVGVIVAVFLSIELMNPVGRLIGSALGLSEGFHAVLGLIVVFVLIQIGAFFVTRTIESVIKAVKLNAVNRALGGAVGLGKAALLLSVLFVVLAFFDIPQRENRQISLLYPYVAGVLPVTWDYVSERLPLIKSLSDQIGTEAREVLEGRSPSGDELQVP